MNLSLTTYALALAVAGWGLLGWKAWAESRRRRRIGKVLADVKAKTRARHEHWGRN